ncbi:hypothetical protein D5085_15820 [Ectothiorhodospiraceae bacterium BW-2]|nr:hypothetical protein D5085_15820 [Ectothiorhodospiraceae bacterium BW-2]
MSPKSQAIQITDQVQMVSVQMGTVYQLIFEPLGQIPTGLLLKREGDDLVVEVEGSPVLLLQSFYEPGKAATATLMGTENDTETTLITTEDSTADGDIVWQLRQETDVLMTEERDSDSGWLWAGGALGLGGVLLGSGGDSSSSGASEVIEPEPDESLPNRHEGKVIDGYVREAIVFADANGNGVLDEGELSTVTVDKGDFLLETADGSPIRGELISIGGIDISTGKAVEGSYRSPEGATIIGPITTLVSKVMKAGNNVDATTAEIMVKRSLSIDEAIELKNYDPIATTTAADATPEQVEQALVTQRIAAQLNTTLGQGASLLTGGGITSDKSTGQEAILDTMADIIVNGLQVDTEFQIDLADTTQTETLFKGATVKAGADEVQQQQIGQVVTAAATATVNLNRTIVEKSSAATTGLDALKAIAAVQIVAEEIENDVQNSAQSGDTAAVVAKSSSSELNRSSEVARTVLGDVDGDDNADADTINNSGEQTDTPNGESTTGSEPTGGGEEEGEQAETPATGDVGETTDQDQNIEPPVPVTPTPTEPPSVTLGQQLAGLTAEQLQTIDSMVLAGLITAGSPELTDEQRSFVLNNIPTTVISQLAPNTIASLLDTLEPASRSALPLSNKNALVENLTETELTETRLAAIEAMYSNDELLNNLNTLDPTALSGNQSLIVSGAIERLSGSELATVNETNLVSLIEALPIDFSSIDENKSADIIGNLPTTVIAQLQSATVTELLDSLDAASQQGLPLSVRTNLVLNMTAEDVDNRGNAILAMFTTDDLANNTELAVVLNAIRPSVIITDDTAGTTNRDVTYTFTFSEAVSGFTVEDVNVNGGTKGTLTTISATEYTLVVSPDSSSVSDMTVDIAAGVVNDGAGNSNVAAIQSVQSVDTLNPDMPTISSAALSNITTPTISGTAEAGSTVTVDIAGATYNTTADSSGNWRIDTATATAVSGTLAMNSNGDNSVSVTATDSAGNRSAVASQTLVVDTTAPILTDMSIASNNSNNTQAKVGDTVTLSFTTDGSHSGTPIVTLGGNGVTVTNTSGNTYTASYTLQAGDTEGAVSFTIDANDAAGNAMTQVTATTDSSSVSFDETAPALTAVSIASDNSDTALAKTGDTVTLSFTTDGSHSGTPTVTLGGNSVTATNTSGNTYTASYTLQAGDIEGTLSFTIDAVDAAGNAMTQVTATTDSSSVSFDETAPALTAVSIASDNSDTTLAKVGDTVTLSFTTDGSHSGTPTVTLGGNSVTATNTSGNTYTASYTLQAGDTEGAVSFTIDAVDAAGNAMTQVTATTDSSSVSFDTTAPALTAVSIASITATPPWPKRAIP